MEYNIVFRCSCCGEEDLVPSNATEEKIFFAIPTWVGGKINNPEIHRCKDGGIGVMLLAGVGKIEKSMEQEHNKITTGFVIQKYKGNIPVSQEFIAGDQVDYEDLDGNPIDYNTDDEEYLPFEMVQPEEMIPLTDEGELTGAFKVELLKSPNHCPRCKSEYIEISNEGSDCNYKTSDCRCEGCGLKWQEVYTLAEIKEID